MGVRKTQRVQALQCCVTIFEFYFLGVWQVTEELYPVQGQEQSCAVGMATLGTGKSGLCLLKAEKSLGGPLQGPPRAFSEGPGLQLRLKDFKGRKRGWAGTPLSGRSRGLAGVESSYSSGTPFSAKGRSSFPNEIVVRASPRGQIEVEGLSLGRGTRPGPRLATPGRSHSVTPSLPQQPPGDPRAPRRAEHCGGRGSLPPPGPGGGAATPLPPRRGTSAAVNPPAEAHYAGTQKRPRGLLAPGDCGRRTPRRST